MSLTDAFSSKQRPEPVQPRAAPAARAAPDDSHARRYAIAALTKECMELRSAPEGVRNHKTNTAAFSMGQLVAVGALTEGEVWNDLREAARAAGLGASEIEKTIASGLAAGKKEPRDIPEPERRAPNGRPAMNQRPPSPAPKMQNHDEGQAEEAESPPQALERKPATIADVIAAWRAEGSLIHEPTGIAKLDELTGGGPVYGTRWYIVGAPDAGKTAFLVQVACVLAARGIAVGICAVDEEADDIVTRVAQRSGWTRHHCETRDRAVLDEMLASLDQLPVRFYDDSWTIERAAADLDAYARKEGMRAMLGIDSIQTVECETERLARATGRELSLREAVTARVRAVRVVATGYRMITIGTSEMNRAAYRTREASEQSNDMAASAESRAPEFSARVLLSLRSVTGESDLVDLKLAKNKHGPRDEHVYLRIDRRSQTLAEVSYDPPPQNREAESSERARVQVTTDAAWVAVVLAENPGLTTRNITPKVRARSGGVVTRERAQTGLAALDAALVTMPGTRGSTFHYLDGRRVPDVVLEAVDGTEARAIVQGARPPTEVLPCCE